MKNSLNENKIFITKLNEDLDSIKNEKEKICADYLDLGNEVKKLKKENVLLKNNNIILNSNNDDKIVINNINEQNENNLEQTSKIIFEVNKQLGELEVDNLEEKENIDNLKLSKLTNLFLQTAKVFFFKKLK